MIYVDEMRDCLKNKNWRYKQACHLVADSVEELHYFAGRMRLNPSWFQDQSSLPHYDLTKGMRLLAVKLGAVEIGKEELLEIIKKYRERRSETTTF